MLDTTAPGASLDQTGVAQSSKLVQTLAGEPLDVVVVSTLRRSEETAAPLVKERSLELLVREGLNEVSAGQLHMRGDDEAILLYLDALCAWDSPDELKMVPGGEARSAAVERFDFVVQELEESPYAAPLIITHAAVAGLWMARRVRNIAPTRFLLKRLKNTEHVILEGSSRDGWLLVR